MLAVFCSLLTARRFLRKDVCRERSGRWHRPTVDNVFGPCDGRRTWRRQKRDQISYLFRLGRPAERNAAKRIHDELSTTLVVGGVLPRDLRDETHSAGSLDPARRDTDDAHPLGTHFLGQRLAVVRQDRKSTRLNSSHSQISYAVFCLKKKKRIWRVLWVPHVLKLHLDGRIDVPPAKHSHTRLRLIVSSDRSLH